MRYGIHWRNDLKVVPYLHLPTSEAYVEQRRDRARHSESLDRVGVALGDPLATSGDLRRLQLDPKRADHG